MSCEGCCNKRPCIFLDGNLQDMIDDVDPEKLNTINRIDAAVRTVFSPQNYNEKKWAIGVIANALASGCVFQVSSASRSISRITGYNERNHKIPTS